MCKKKLITGGKVVLPTECIKASVLLENGIIAEVFTSASELSYIDAEVIDAKGLYVMPGFVEIHAHGGGGFDFMDATEDAFEKICDTHLTHGTTSLAPTSVACSEEAMEDVFETYRKMQKKSKINLLGLHLEGPFISTEMKGAQNPSFVRNPEKFEVDKLLAENGDIISMCTAAPEIDGIEYMAKKMRDNGVTLSVGHSNGTCVDAKKAWDMGFTHITHLYSSTPTVRKINEVIRAGILEAAYLYDFDIELIGDGHHVAEEAFKLAMKIKGADKINLTSDAMRGAGTYAHESYLGAVLPENRVIIEGGVAKLPDRSSFAGSIATGDIMLKWAVNTCGFDICTASKLLSATPARIISADSKGSIESDKDGDLIFVDKDLNIQKVIVNGKYIKE